MFSGHGTGKRGLSSVIRIRNNYSRRGSARVPCPEKAGWSVVLPRHRPHTIFDREESGTAFFPADKARRGNRGERNRFHTRDIPIPFPCSQQISSHPEHNKLTTKQSRATLFSSSLNSPHCFPPPCLNSEMHTALGPFLGRFPQTSSAILRV